MRTSRVVLIIIVALIVVSLIWFFRPVLPSDLKGDLYGSSYLAGMVKIKYLWDSPFISIISSVPGMGESLQRMPFFLRPLLPPTVELYMLTNSAGGGWGVAVDLGWRSRLFKLLHGFIMEQIQYRGFGAIEGENIIRTPDGFRILLYQDAGTLFVAEGEDMIGKIHGLAHAQSHMGSVGTSGGVTAKVKEKRDIAYISFSNHDMEISMAIEELERSIGFLLFPSAGSIKDGTIAVRYASGKNVVAEIYIVAREGGDIEGIEGDISYLLDLLDRFLSTSNFKTDRTINRENNSIIAQVMMHLSGGGSEK